MLAPETPLHLLEHLVLPMLFIFVSIREFEVDPDVPTLVRPHLVIQQFCVPIPVYILYSRYQPTK